MKAVVEPREPSMSYFQVEHQQFSVPPCCERLPGLEAGLNLP